MNALTHGHFFLLFVLCCYDTLTSLDELEFFPLEQNASRKIRPYRETKSERRYVARTLGSAKGKGDGMNHRQILRLRFHLLP